MAAAFFNYKTNVRCKKDVMRKPFTLQKKICIHYIDPVEFLLVFRFPQVLALHEEKKSSIDLTEKFWNSKQAHEHIASFNFSSPRITW